jgi:hypothetical protein
MSIQAHVDAVIKAAESLLEEVTAAINNDELKYSEADYLVHKAREAEGYLMSCRKMVTPGEVL